MRATSFNHRFTLRWLFYTEYLEDCSSKQFTNSSSPKKQVPGNVENASFLLIQAFGSCHGIRFFHRYDLVKGTFLLLQALLRVPLCVLLSGMTSHFSIRSVALGVVLILLALPHSLMWGSYGDTWDNRPRRISWYGELGMMIYQWAVINHTERINKLVKNMFERWKHFLTSLPAGKRVKLIVSDT